MSTRANVIIQKVGEDTAILYHHHDGYPKGVGQELVRFIMKYRFAPPVEFETLLLFSPMEGKVRDAILELVRLKREGKEHDEEIVPTILQQYGEQLLKECETEVAAFHPMVIIHDIAEVLDHCMYQFVEKYSR